MAIFSSVWSPTGRQVGTWVFQLISYQQGTSQSLF
jgi:hypothetical protein